MAVSEAKKKANAKYQAKTYDVVSFRMKKGKRDIVTAHSESRNESFAGFINRAIDETMERDNRAGMKKRLLDIKKE
jgi:hypothetical protein